MAMQGLGECRLARHRHLFIAVALVLVALGWAQAHVQDDSDLVFEDELIQSEHHSEIVKRAAPAALDEREQGPRSRRRGTRPVSLKKKKKQQDDISSLLKPKPSRLRQRQVADDEDLGDYEGSGIEGSGDPIVPVPPIAGKKFIRCSVVIQEPFDVALQDRDSVQFQTLAGSFSEAAEKLYETVFGNQIATVHQFSSDADKRHTRVSFDIGSENNVNEALLENTLKKAVQSGRIGPFIAKEEGFGCRSVQGPDVPVQCTGTDEPCRSGGCYAIELRCNGVNECADGTDEEGCFSEDYDTPIPVPTQGPVVDECRGDDKFRCRDGLQIICKVQECDGSLDCRDGSDEIGCPTPTCPEFTCDRNRCILNSQVCDNNPDCSDGTDEVNCPEIPACGQEEFLCRDSRCIPDRQRCDGQPDCSSGEDELDCNEPCPIGEFQCRDRTCVSLAKRCDGEYNCPDGSDEDGCRCAPYQWQCNDGTCINRDLKCDGKRDCPDLDDNSDEENCPTTTARPSVPALCAEDQFQCDDGQCIDKKFYCDSLADCLDRSDEKDCSTCRDDQFRCSDNTCIDAARKCNGVPDCIDSSDEVGCPPEATPSPIRCRENEFECLAGGCVEDSLRCDGFRDCPDGSDETECGCRSDQFQCADRSCIDNRRKCDGVNDCRDGSDEANCVIACRAGEFRCNTGDCIDDSRRCDRVIDCPDRSDEQNCPVICRGGEFTCATGNQCIRESQVCDGRPDCADYSDESNCQGSSEGLDLKTYPNEQTILQGREVVFQCRDEGPLRAPVRWIRGNGLSLPAGSRDVNGRLEMPDIQPEHAGTYICEAAGYPSTTAGSRVSVYLQVTPYVEPTARPPTACGINEATCMNGECIPKNAVCDGNFDCSDQSDEMRCSLGGCEPNEYQCENKRCVLKTWRCDGDDDCGDNSDEKSCAPSLPGSPCRYDEFQCASRNQCIPKSFHCDMEIDCQDRSDEIGCSKPSILIPPPSSMMVNEGETFVMNCTAYGIPTPEVVWRLNWGHVPPKCTMTSVNGVGVLTCPNAEATDQGAYSCEAINAKGSTFAIPDCIVTVKPGGCSQGYFGAPECLPCFCFGESNECRSSSLYVSQLSPPSDQFQLITLRPEIAQGRSAFIPTREFEASASQNRNFLRSTPANNGIQVQKRTSGSRDVAFFNLPNSHRGNQLRSYGGYLRYQLLFRGSGNQIRSPDIIMIGNGITIYHESRTSFESNRQTAISVRFWPGQWYKRTSGRPGGDIPIGSDQLATREDIMMVLQNIEYFLLRASYLDGPLLDTTISQITMDTAVEQNTNQGQAIYVEDCRCPAGYMGLSCDECAPGYVREQSGSWLGRCVPQQTSNCNPLGTLTSSGSNCVCKPGVTGPRCDQCKTNHYFLGGSEDTGCLNCFCMGITQTCTSSNWYRQQERAVFTSDTLGFALTDKQQEPVTDRITVNLVNREIIYRDFNRLSSEVYYWKLPPKFLGDKVASYGGRLNYTVRYVPVPGGRNSPNTAPDIELVGNRIKLFYYRREQIESSRSTFVSVPIVENVWQRQDGGVANREHLLMALADLDHIYIKATYTTGTQEAALSEVTLDIAEERYTGQSRAVEVEQCSCPPGYKGLSCEDCDAGYTRSSEGVYLGLCEPCNCNGHSNECDPDTGVCINCRDHTTGEFCDQCAPGYEGDATGGTSYDCRPSQGGCTCDPRGSSRPDCPDGRSCVCKVNVEGSSCDSCKEGTFALMQQNPLGCLNCFCSGVTSQCFSTRLFRTQIPMQVLDSQHGFTLNDRAGPINVNVGVNVGENELSYTYPQASGQSQRLYWSLPSLFTGNKVTSYGGKLAITQRYEERPGFGQRFIDNDVILTGNGISLAFVNPEQIQPGQTVSYTVPLREAGWRRLDRGTTASAAVSREDMMTVLSNLASIQIRATFSGNMAATYISDVVMDTTVSQNTGQEQPVDVEECRCPQGYRGTSCEECEAGYYRDFTSNRYGVCRRCPCNGREESCSVNSDGRSVVCVCRSGYSGQFCEIEDSQPPPAPTIVLSITEPRIQVATVGSTVKFHCRGQSLIGRQVSMSWSKEGGVLPPGRAQDDRRGVLIITNVRASDSGTYVCSAVDGITTLTETAVLNVGDSGPREPQVSVEPRYVDATVGQSVLVRCVADGTPRPSVQWQNARGSPVGSEIASPDGTFRIASVRKADEGEYICSASNSAGTNSARISIYVRDAPKPPPATIQVVISPQETVVRRGEAISLSCRADVRDASDRFQSVPIIRWSRVEGPLPVSSTQAGGILSIPSASPTDSGIYVCTVTIASGAVQQSQARVTILPHWGPPTVRVEPDRQTIAQGTTAELRCQATGDPSPTVRWSKVGEELTSNIQITGPVLRIVNAMVRDRGMYICIAENQGGTAQASAIIEVERREPPSIELYPQGRQTIVTGGSALFQCRVTGGIPLPRVKWSRVDQRPFTSSVEELEGGVIRFSRVTGTEQGQYVCTADNDAGTISAVATLDIQSVPVITISPGGSSVRAKIGQRLRLECRSSGSPAPTVSWRRLRTGFLFDTLDTRAGESQQLAVYEVTRVTQSDEGTYSCTAKNEAGITEERIQVVVEPQRGDIDEENEIDTGDSKGNIRIDNVPATAVGGSIELRCIVDGPKDGIYLQWVRSDGREMPADHYIQDGVLTIRNVQPSAAGEYSCEGIGSDGARLFSSATRFQVVAPPRITLNPQRQVVRPGDFVTIECSASGDQPITINWSKENGVLPSSVVINGGIIQFRGIAASDAGRYVCAATNSLAVATSVAEVAVNEDRTVSSNQREQTVTIGSTISLRCSDAARGPNVRARWSRDRGALPPTALVNGAELQLTNVQPSDAGRYICQMTGPGGVSNEYILLNVQRATNLAIRIVPSQETVRRGDNLEVRCEVTGDPSAIVSWKRVGAPMSRNIQTLGHIMRVTDVRSENGGLYQCHVLSNTGTFEEKYVLSIQAQPDFALDAATVETHTASVQTEAVVMECRTNLRGAVSYSWSRQGGVLPKGSRVEGSKLTLVKVRAEDAGTYVCTARNTEESIDIPTVLVVTGVVPYFAQAPLSYMELPTLPDAYLQFDIEISFKPEAPDGLILYNGQQSGGGGDFVSFGLSGGYAEFRFDMGAGPAVIRSDKTLELGKWHTVKLSRNRKDGTMMIDGEGPFFGSASGRFLGLDLLESLYIGGVLNFKTIHKQSGFTRGFVGCISRLVIGSVPHELVRDSKSSRGITTCETCALNPCENGGVCQEAYTEQGYSCICPSGFSGSNCEKVGEACSPGACGTGKCVNVQGGFECYCPFGKSGSRCEKDIVIYEPAFSDGAYVAYSSPPKAVLRRMKMSMRFKPRQVKDGLLMYCGQTDAGQGDFTSLAIKDRRVEFRFNSGTGPAILRSDREIRPGEWVTVTADRNLKEGTMAINDGPEIRGRSPGSSRGLNLHTKLFVGGWDKHGTRLNSGVNVTSGFDGCISSFEVAGMELDMINSVIDSANVEDCGGQSPCDRKPCSNNGLCSETGSGVNDFVCQCEEGFRGKTCEIEEDLCLVLKPCQNGGTCVGTSNAYKCNCPLGYGATNCETKVELGEEVSFKGDGYVELSRSLLPRSTATTKETVVMEFSTLEANGILFWHGQNPDTDGKGQDFVALAVVDGRLEFSYELGSGPAQITSPIRVDDGRRHRIVARRTARNGSIDLDGAFQENGQSLGALQMLNTKGNIFIGGLPNADGMTAGRFLHGFSGCIHSVQIHESGNINYQRQAVAAVNALPCSSDDLQQLGVQDANYDDDWEPPAN